jgi:hypothetical protein
VRVTEPRGTDDGGGASPDPREGPAPALQVREVCGVLAVLGPVPAGPQFMMQAVVSGEVAVLDGGCIGLVGGRARHLVVWPSTTTFDAGDRIVIRVPGLGVFRVGDPLHGAGGYGYSADMALPAVSLPCATPGIALLNEVQEEAGRSRAERRRSRRL